MNQKFRITLTLLHFIALSIAILNFIADKFTVYSLEGHIELGIELFVVISGLLLFFFYVKPFKRINYYFSIYSFAALIVIIGLIFRGLFLGVIVSILLFPVIPDEKEFEENGIIISTPFKGFLAACCSYEVKERKLLIFEKHYESFKLTNEGSIDFETMRVERSATEIRLTYSSSSDEGVVKERVIER